MDEQAARAFVPAVDALALVVFVLIGLASHHEGGGLQIFIRNAVPLIACWFVVALVLKTYRRGRWLKALLLNWAIAVPAGLLIRTWIVGSPTRPARIALFLAVGMAFTLLFLIAGRVFVRVILRQRMLRTGGQ